jgi:microcompartment protein CcmL/EutN
MENGALGVLEMNSIACGIEAADAMLKRAAVSLYLSRPICPGKHITMVHGLLADVIEAVAAGAAMAGDRLVDSLILARPHPGLLPAMTQTSGVTGLSAVGIIECFSLCAALRAADAAVTRAAVDLIEVRLAIMMAGKGFVTFTGDESAVKEAVDAAAAIASGEGMLAAAVVIPQPREELLSFLV